MILVNRFFKRYTINRKEKSSPQLAFRTNQALKGGDMSYMNLSPTIFINAGLSDAKLSWVITPGIDFSYTNLTNANLTNANLSGREYDSHYIWD